MGVPNYRRDGSAYAVEWGIALARTSGGDSLYLLRQACEQLAALAADSCGRDLVVSVNIRARQFDDPDFADRVLRVLERTGVEPQRLRLELTESVLVRDMNWTVARMDQLREQGVTFALDDFGTGSSSLSHLARLPLDVLKSDQGFVRDVTGNAGNVAIARTIIALVRSLDMQVLAAGVETAEVRAFLTDAGCDAFQGDFFGAPMPASGWLAEFRGSLG
ncbi:MAG: EAL domain-containing protein [Ectothiorhodospiraceae bacterium]